MSPQATVNNQTTVSGTLEANLNFAADRTNGGIWSNGNPSLTTQKLQPHKVSIHNARLLTPAPSLDREGFTFVRHPVSGNDWHNPEWINGTYIPETLAMVQQITGAAKVLTFPMRATLIRDTGNSSMAPAAQFVHIDQIRESAELFLSFLADAQTIAKYPRVKMFNVWRPTTPPPQDVPLAICDQTTLAPSDWVIGRTVEPDIKIPEGVPYLASVYNPGQVWYYIPDLTPDDAVIFQGYDNNPDLPLGCLHGAFTHPIPPAGAVPRASIEMRLFALFE
jgi:hypothetical protein